MKKIIIIAVAVVVLIACLAVARLADQRTSVPQNGTTPSGTSSYPTAPSSSSNATPGDTENGLGWG